MRAVVDGKGELPDSVLSVVEARLGALEPDARRVLRAASVFGQFFWPGGVAAVLGDTDEEAASGWIAALTQREIVSPRAHSRFDAEPELTFRHALVRDTVYSMLTPEDRAVAHRAAASWLEARGEGEAAVLAAHLEAAGDRERAAQRYLRAASQMLGGGEVDASAELVAHGLACARTPETRAELLLLEADGHRWSGNIGSSARAADDAMQLSAPESEVHMKALGISLLAHLKLGHDERRRELLAEAMARLEQCEPSVAACRLAAAAGTGALFAGEVTLATRIDQLVDRLVGEDTVDAAAHSQLHVFRAFLSDARGELEAQIHHFDAAASYCEQAGNERQTLLHRTNGAFARTLVGDYEEAARRLFDVLDVAAQRRVQFVVDTARCDLGATLLPLGRVEQARDQAARAAEGFKRSGDHRMEAASRAYLARALFELGQAAHAFTEIHAARALAQHARQIEPFILAALAEMELRAGDADAAIAHATEAQKTLRETRSDGAHETLVAVTLARALVAAHRGPEADAAFAEAHRRLRERLDLIRDARLRDCFMRIEENAAVLAWAARSR